MKKVIATILIAALMAAALSCGFAEEAFQEASCSVAAGYYSSNSDGSMLLLADGTLCEISSKGSKDGGTYTVYSDGECFFIETSPDECTCFVPMRDKERTETGGVYYAVYPDYIGTVDQGFEEGRQVQYGGRVFDNDYIVFVREPLSVFFGVDGGAGGNGQVEGPGYATPEEAVSAYIQAFQENDYDGMLSTFAVETLVEHFDLATFVDLVHSYGLFTGYVPSISNYSRALNVAYRESIIADSIRYQYLILTGAECITNGGKTIAKEEGVSGEEFVAEHFATDDSPWLKEIDFQEEFLAPQTFTENYDSERNQALIARSAAYYGGDEVQNVAARLEIAGEPYVQFMEVIRYGDRWYNLNLVGNLAVLMGLNNYSGGLSPYPIPED